MISGFVFHFRWRAPGTVRSTDRQLHPPSPLQNDAQGVKVFRVRVQIAGIGSGHFRF